MEGGAAPMHPPDADQAQAAEGNASPPGGTGGAAEELQAVRDRGRGEYGCRHYRRRVRFVTPCCNEEWWCRHCHNEAKYQQEEDWSRKHELDRKRITDVVCALCHERQPVGEACVACGVSFGAYSCTKCPFYDDDASKLTYHCDDCGICRVGGRGNFFHCATCGSCYAANLRNNHVCVERAMHHNCPVCFEFLFESVDPTTVLRCGHTIHSQCLRELERNTANICPCCPICSKSLGDYTRYWQALDLEVRGAAVPEEYAGWKAKVVCNDCAASSTAPFNLIALRCSHCGSYNTRRMGIDTGADGVGALAGGAGAAAGAPVAGEPAAPLAAAGAEGLAGGDGGGGGGNGAAGGAGGQPEAAIAAAAAAAADAAMLEMMEGMMGGMLHGVGDGDDEEEEWEDAEAEPDPDEAEDEGGL